MVTSNKYYHVWVDGVDGEGWRLILATHDKDEAYRVCESYDYDNSYSYVDEVEINGWEAYLLLPRIPYFLWQDQKVVQKVYEDEAEAKMHHKLLGGALMQLVALEEG